MRKSKGEAAETRAKIVAAAAGEFRGKGIVATSLGDLMAAAGLTHGGFYKHFGSKDQVVTEACAEGVRSLLAMLSEVAPGEPARAYLSARHRDNPAGGCPLAALGSELARADDATRAVATDGFLRLAGLIAGRSGGGPPGEAGRRALVAASTMIGALTMSRVVNDPGLSAEILRLAEEDLAGA